MRSRLRVTDTPSLFGTLQTVVNVASVPKLSPFRYPGGKTWLVPHARRWFESWQGNVNQLIEPFAGGGIISLTAVFEGFVERATLVELDAAVAAVWHVVLSDRAEELAERIIAFKMSEQNVRDVLVVRSRSLMNLAFATILRNRVQHGGIMAAGASLMKEGEAGKGLASRWYPKTLANRILDIHDRRDRLHLVTGDGLTVLKEHKGDRHTASFIDPPYTVAGKRLYTHSQVDHPAVFDVAAAMRGPVLMTYDNTPEVAMWALCNGLQSRHVAMKSRQHTNKNELLIGHDLSWLD